MSEFRTIRELCSVVADCPHSTPKWTTNGKIVVRNNNIKHGRIDLSSPSYTDEEHFAQRIKRANPQPGDIIITREAPIGDVGMIPENTECCLGQRMVLLRADQSVCDNFYLLYSLQSLYVQHQISWSEGTGTTVSNLRIPHLEQIQIPYLPLEQQTKISSVLRALEEKIENNRRLNDNLLAQAKAVKKQWVATNEDGYEMLPLAEVAAINPDTYSPKEAWAYVNYLDTSSITDGFIADVQHIVPSSEKLPSRARRKVAAGDVLFSTVRPNQNHFGIISDPLPNMLASTGFADIRSKTSLVCNELIYLCLTEGDFIEKMQQLAEQSTSTFPSIKPSDLGACQIPCPKDESSNVFTDTLKSLFSLIAANFRENDSLGAMRDALLPRLMSGEIDASAVQL